MKNTLPQFVLGYHGCDKEIVKKILNSEIELKSSKNKYDWLGNGIYFWENAPCRAMQWAEECAMNKKMTKGAITNPAVIGAIIDLGNCLNLTDQRYQNIIREAYNGLEEMIKKQSFQMPKNEGALKKLDCAVINATVKLNRDKGYQEFDSIRSPYFEGEELYPNATFKNKTHIQICILNKECIKGYFLPTEKEFLKG